MKNQSVKGSYEDYLTGNIANKEFHFRLLKENGVPTLTDSKGQPVKHVGSHKIELFSIITEPDPKTGKPRQRTLRYIQGETSIYKDEQTDDKEVPKKKYFAEFNNGKKVLSGSSDASLLDAMMKHNLCLTNKFRVKTVSGQTVQPLYELIDVAKIIKKNMEADKIEAQAVSFAYDGDWEEVKAYASVLGVNLSQSVDEIRHDMKNLAKRTSVNPSGPEKFMAGLKDPTMKKKYYVMEAVEQGYLVINHPNNSIAWENNPLSPVHVAAEGKNIIDSFVNALSTQKGEHTYQAILDIVRPIEETIVPEAKVPSKSEIAEMRAAKNPGTPLLVVCEETDEQLESMVADAHERDIIEFTPPVWYKYKGGNYKKTEKLVEALKSNAVMLQCLKSDLKKYEEANTVE